ncbi:hypothetical protein NW754_003605 [Fusarium falciforme]|uniref:LysM domain-containing protein n=1 Tax=Fusarium falciforme TaxID=195108 RepID=A0A9W8RAB5_9HYPO|nr:hypothetical protein NW754_003605 [Fusarium falciforme]KAJ4192599.1 hypothetical protein NW755_003746 [Fusarium falciforme]KAJ4210611.1 hypothetical protein NW767_000884 [Fusarium falciforme]KAJ4250375.1 hypothetical protein NW757_007206 [Fusarium falciforme]
MVGIVQLTVAVAAVAGVASAATPIELSHPHCDQFVYGQRCQEFTSTFGLSQQAFLNMNPSINPSNCNQLPASWYCVRTRAPGAPISTPSPSSGTFFNNCAKFALGFPTPGTCWNIATAFGLSWADWNHLHPDSHFGDSWRCDLLRNVYWCVELIQDTPPPPITTTAAAPSTTKPKTTTTKRKTTSTRRPRLHKDQVG